MKKNEQEPKEYKGILTVWQIDSFEGGTGSRRQFLLKIARAFENKFSGVLVMVVNHTKSSAEESISAGKYPDIISFGNGVEIKGVSELNVTRATKGGMIGNKIYATVWCRGGYVLIANPALVEQIDNNLDDIIVSQGEYTQPLTALLLDGYVVDNIQVLKPMDAYVKFVEGKTPYFLGTQRDINRLERRGMSVKTKTIYGYNDLYQYICILGVDQLKRYYAEEFINYLLSDSIQKQLSEIGMLSAFTDVNYDNQVLTDMQNLMDFSTVSSFTSAAELKELQNNSLKALNGKKEYINKIKNMLI